MLAVEPPAVLATHWQVDVTTPGLRRCSDKFTES
jgi:hypothetical protein